MPRFTTLLVLCMLVAALSVSAQPSEIRWDFLGPRSGEIIVQPGPSGPSSDTLFMVSEQGISRLAPGNPHFGPVSEQPFRTRPEYDRPYHVTKRGTHLSSAGRIVFSEDGGATWARAETLFEGQPFGGTRIYHYLESDRYGLIAVGESGTLWQSADDGRTWALVSNLDVGLSGNLDAIIELQGDTRPGAKPSPWAGRLLISFERSVQYSGIGERTFYDATAPVKYGWDQLEEGKDGSVYATYLIDPDVFVSRDGGETWKEFARLGGHAVDLLGIIPSRSEPIESIRIATGPDGSVWAGLSATVPPDSDGSIQREGVLMYTRDGGKTWTEVEEDFGGASSFAPSFDRLGRLIVVTDTGVYRTADSLAEAFSSEAP